MEGTSVSVGIFAPELADFGAANIEFGSDADASFVSLSDEQLMLRYQRGDSGAFGLLYQRHRVKLHRVLVRLIDDRSVAEEVFQETWLAVIEARSRYSVQAKFTTYLFSIAHRRLSEHWRQNIRARRSLSSEDADTHISADSDLELAAQQEELRGAFSAAVDTLPFEQREALLLRADGELSLEEIAIATGVGRETAKSRLRYALDKLRWQLRDWA
jgi:RNA polymerase sigma-70 factor (ECF subfamily)